MLKIFTIPVTPFAQNARILFDSQSGQAAIIDPGGDVDRIWSVMEQLKATGLMIVLTHAHIDHAGGVATCLEMVRRNFPDVRLSAHKDDQLRGTVARQAMVYGLPAAEYLDVPEPDVLLDDGDSLVIGDHEARVLWTPGHAPDHLSFYFNAMQVELYEDGRVHSANVPVLIAGDTLFSGSIGRTDLPGGNTSTLLRSIHEKLLVLPDNTLVLSGHGPNTTIGHERLTNPFLQD